MGCITPVVAPARFGLRPQERRGAKDVSSLADAGPRVELVRGHWPT